MGPRRKSKSKPSASRKEKAEETRKKERRDAFRCNSAEQHSHCDAGLEEKAKASRAPAARKRPRKRAKRSAATRSAATRPNSIPTATRASKKKQKQAERQPQGKGRGNAQKGAPRRVPLQLGRTAFPLRRGPRRKSKSKPSASRKEKAEETRKKERRDAFRCNSAEQHSHCDAGLEEKAKASRAPAARKRPRKRAKRS